MTRNALPLLAAALISFAVAAPAATSASERGKSYQSSKNLKGKRKLNRLLNNHYNNTVRQPITRDIREAAGVSAVFDHRVGPVTRCSYITYRGERALVCD